MDRINREDLILDNVRLVYHVAKQYRRQVSGDWDDIIGSGYLGLVKAARAFDESKGFAFTSLAVHCIRMEIFQYFRKLRKHMCVQSLDQEISLDGNRIYTHIDQTPDPKDPIREAEDRLFLEGALCRCKESELIRDYYGIGRAPLRQEALAKKYGQSQSYISRRISKAVGDMKNYRVAG